MVCFNVCSMFLVLNNVIYFEWLVFLIYEYFVIYYEIGIVNKWMGFILLIISIFVWVWGRFWLGWELLWRFLYFLRK